MFLASPPEFRILADETNLLGIAASMYDEHEFYNTTSGLYYYHSFHELRHVWGIRPVFYPFLIYVSHALLGYDAYHGFLVNAVAGVISLWCLYWLLKQVFPTALAIAGLLTLAAFPVFVMWVTSSGFEIVNLALSLICFCWLFQFLETQDTYHLERLVLSLVLLAQTRYESAMFAVGMLIVVASVMRHQHYRQLSLRAIIWPLLFLPIAVQRLLKTSKKDYQVYDDKSVFSSDFLIEHAQTAVDYFMASDPRYGSIALVTVLALGGLIFGGGKLALNWRQTPLTIRGVAVAGGIAYGLLCVAIFSYYWGDLTAAFTIRLGIIFLPLLIVLALVFVNMFFVKMVFMNVPFIRGAFMNWPFVKEVVVKEMFVNKSAETNARAQHFVVIAAIGLILFYWPGAGKNESTSQLTLYRQYKTVLNYLEVHYPDRNIAIIADRPGLYTPHRWGAVSFSYGNKHKKRLTNDLKRKLYQEILVLQSIRYGKDLPLRKQALDPYYKTEMLYESQYSATKKLRLSRVVLP